MDRSVGKASFAGSHGAVLTEAVRHVPLLLNVGRWLLHFKLAR